MPTSDRQGKFIATALINQANPLNVWDVGAGAGTYRDLIPLDQDTDRYWTAVEIWKPYIRQFDLVSKYETVIDQDIRTYPFKDRRKTPFDLIIFGDVLEHMPEDDARRLVLEAKKSFRWILVSVPIVHSPQGAVNGNPYEAHLKHWSFEEMHEIMGRCMAFKGHTIGLFWWDSEDDI